jgi:hypothetical protein
VFLADFASPALPPDNARVHGRGIAEDFYALAATMYFTGMHIDLPYDSFVHRDTRSDLRGGTGEGEVTSDGSDRATFGNFSEGGVDQVLDQEIADPRVSDGNFANTYDMDVQPEHVGAAPVNQQGQVNGAGETGLRLRSGPGLSYPAAAALSNGTGLTVLYRQGDWVYVRLDSGGEGWVSAAYVSGS